MSYVAAADFRERTMRPWCVGIVLGEPDGTDAYLDELITLVTARIEHDLRDDFEPPSPDDPVTISVDGNGALLLDLPRRVRVLTTVETLDTSGAYTTQSATTYRLNQSLNAAGTAMNDGQKLDTLEALSITCGVWPHNANAVRLTGKFGWAAVPQDIKRLVALRVYDLAKGSSDPLSRVVQRTTVDQVITLGESREILAIEARYRRDSVMVA